MIRDKHLIALDAVLSDSVPQRHAIARAQLLMQEP